MRLVQENRVSVMGMAVAAVALIIACLTGSVAYAVTCTTSDCTYWSGGLGYDGSCGTNNSGCVCNGGGSSQSQAACKATQ